MEKAMLYQHLLSCAKELDAYLRYSAELKDESDRIDYSIYEKPMKILTARLSTEADLAIIEDQM